MKVDTKNQISITVSGRAWTVPDLCRAASRLWDAEIDTDEAQMGRMAAAVAVVQRAVDEGRPVYGVTTGFGGMAHQAVPRDQAAASQDNLLSFLAAGAGPALDRRHVRAAMLLRANVLARGYSGVRPEIVHRIVRFLQADATPVVRELGSIGASGDLVPLSAIARAITGVNGFVRIQVENRIVDGATILKELGLEPLHLLPKEGLAIVNGTSFSTAIAANCVFETRPLMCLAIATQCLMMRALVAQEEPFEEFVHRQKPHPGQIWTASIVRQWLTGNLRQINGHSVHVQDRYSIRCLPQYAGPIVEGIQRITRTVETEMNAVSDNPLVDAENDRFYQSGNFLGQYIGIAMDDLRRLIGLLAKHLDVQIATLVSPEFSNGLPASLRGNSDRPYNMGLKGLQIVGNSIMPLLTYYGNPVVEHFPTHAEQFNQNINGLSWGSANLAWKSVEMFQHYMALSLLFSVQALDLRAKSSLGHFDGRALLNPLAVCLYEAVCESMDCDIGPDKPFLFDDSDQWLEQRLATVRDDICAHGGIVSAVEPILASLDESAF